MGPCPDPPPRCAPQAMESKLLIGGRTIVDHTNEQQKMLELKRQEIAEQVTARGPDPAWGGDGGVPGGGPVPLPGSERFPPALQKRREREMQQEMLLRDEETMELRETYTSLQQEVEIKTKKLKKVRGWRVGMTVPPRATGAAGLTAAPPRAVGLRAAPLPQLYAKLQAVKAEIQDQHDEYIRVRQDLEEAQNEQTRELKLK